MTTPPSGTPAPPKWKPLEARERRVLGVLIEKAKTTPAGYPMSVNAIVTGCNQKNNRDPLTEYDDIEVEKGLEHLRVAGVVTEVDWVGRVSKWKHLAYDWFGVNRAELAVLGELLLRGAQQLGELRARAGRMEPIADLAELKPIVESLVARGLMIELSSAGRGQLVSHGVYPAEELAQVRAAASGRAQRDEEPARPGPARASEASSTLTQEVASLRAEVDRLRERVDALESQER
jgi:uncharacterized protein YceH (UPF0502 family)